MGVEISRKLISPLCCSVNVPGPLSIDLIVPETRAHLLSTTNSCPSALISFTVSKPSSVAAMPVVVVVQNLCDGGPMGTWFFEQRGENNLQHRKLLHAKSFFGESNAHEQLPLLDFFIYAIKPCTWNQACFFGITLSVVMQKQKRDRESYLVPELLGLVKQEDKLWRRYKVTRKNWKKGFGTSCYRIFLSKTFYILLSKNKYSNSKMVLVLKSVFVTKDQDRFKKK